MMSVGLESGSQSIHAAGDWNLAWPPVCAEMRHALPRCSACVRNVVYGYDMEVI
jgi:hypothetical protein